MGKIRNLLKRMIDVDRGQFRVRVLFVRQTTSIIVGATLRLWD
jgi:hypothetical protein